MNEFMTLEILATFAGLVTAVALIVQFTKSLVKKKFNDVYVRVYALIISLILTFIFAGEGYSIDGIVLTVINAVIVTITAMGGYEVISDPKAQKSK
jgi:uncharacterized protein with PQ loop repeat